MYWKRRTSCKTAGGVVFSRPAVRAGSGQRYSGGAQSRAAPGALRLAAAPAHAPHLAACVRHERRIQLHAAPSVDEQSPPPGLEQLLAYARKGDTLVIVRLDRLGRSLAELLATVTMLKERGIALLSLEEKMTPPRPPANWCSTCSAQSPTLSGA